MTLIMGALDAGRTHGCWTVDTFASPVVDVWNQVLFNLLC